MTLALDTAVAVDSPLGRLDPRWRLAGLLTTVAAVTSLRTPLAAVLAAGFGLLVAVVGQVPPRWFLSRLGGFLLAVAPFVVVLLFTAPMVAAALLARSVAIGALVLSGLAAAPLAVSLHAARALRVPGLLVQLALLTHRYLHLLADEFARLRIALKARGFRAGTNRHTYRTAGHVAGTLLVRGAERAERVAAAMRCRGFDGQFRTLTDFHTRSGDVAAFLVFLAAAAGLVAVDLVGRG